MNKFIKFISALSLALAITACDKQDPKQDFKKFSDWNNSQVSQQGKIVSEFQAAVNSAKNPDELNAVLKKYQDESNAIIASLDKLELSSPDLVEYKQKYKAALQLSLNITVSSIQSMIKPLSTEEKAQLQGQVTELQSELQDIEETNKVLQEKYGNVEENEAAPATQAQPATESAPAAESAPATETAPATEVTPVAENAPATEVAPAAESAPATEVAPAVETEAK